MKRMKSNFWLILVLLAPLGCGNGEKRSFADAQDDNEGVSDGGDVNNNDDDDPSTDSGSDDDAGVEPSDGDVPIDVGDDDDDTTCVPSKEICDGKDNDCDGDTDEDSALEMGCDNDIFCDGVEQCLGGFCVVEIEPEDCAPLSDECNDGVCDEATRGCQAVPKENGTLCNADSDGCTENDYCQDGDCLSGKAVDCSGAVPEEEKQCNIGVCYSAGNNEYACGKESLPNETRCDADGDGCTVGDTCQAGVCEKGPAPDCSEATDACNAGTCFSAGSETYECVPTPMEDQTPCDADGDGCTVGDTCQAGICEKGLPADCSGVNTQCKTGICISQGQDKFVCSSTSKNNGAACLDNDGCTVGDNCQAGICVAGTPADCSTFTNQCNDGVCEETADHVNFNCVAQSKPNNTACNADSNGCTVGDTCQNGSCQAGASRDCSKKTDDCNRGICVEDSSTSSHCAAKPRSNGTSCEDGQYCTVGDSCQDGDCQAGPVKDCSPLSDECNNGVCDETADSCEKSPINEGGLCNDGEICTTTSTCQSGECKGVDDKDADTDTFIDKDCGGTDCDDGDNGIYPGALDTVGDGIDQNCDGRDGVDADSDTYASIASGGTDCDDGNNSIHPNADDNDTDAVDENCDGKFGGALAGDVDADDYAALGTDGVTVVDCDDDEALAYPNNPTDKLDSIDNDCDGWDGKSESIRDIGRTYLQISLDSQEKIWILGGKWLSNNKDGNWENEQWNLNMASDTDMALDSSDNIHISYRCEQGLCYAKRAPDESLETTIIDNDDPQTGKSTSIALDDDGYPRISYRGYNGDLREARWNGANWEIQVVHAITDLDRGTSLVIQNNLSRISYERVGATDGLWLAEEQSDSSWVKNKIDITYSGLWSSMAADSGGKLHISSGYFTASGWSLRITTNASGDWAGEHVDFNADYPRGWATSMAVDSNGKRHVLYLAFEEHRVIYATDKSGSWVLSVIGEYKDGEEANFITAITINSGNEIHAVYFGDTALGGPCDGLCYVK
ncbi:MAG: MopE-related protein [Patescibacteria group bacterium]|nr:MopE-related protein [Patescibacteria group bacterium]MDD5490676.1 MopE-related protein [Patescibacteria group bacterium]